MKVKILSRNPDQYLRETKRDIQKGKYINCMSNILFYKVMICIILFMKKSKHFEDNTIIILFFSFPSPTCKLCVFVDIITSVLAIFLKYSKNKFLYALQFPGIIIQLCIPLKL